MYISTEGFVCVIDPAAFKAIIDIVGTIISAWLAIKFNFALDHSTK